MTDHILINTTPFETRVALMEQGTLQELHIERTSQRGKVGNIYLGKVIRVLPGMQSAFINIGLDRAAFIHIGDLRESRIARINGLPPPHIEKILFEGQSLMVQVIKDAINNKGARLSTQISIAGRMLVYLPYDPHIGVSQKVESEPERERLKKIIINLKSPHEEGGYIIRTQAELANEEEIQRDMGYLGLRWQKIQESLYACAAPCLIYEDLNLLERVMRDLVVPETNAVDIDSRQATQHLKKWASIYTPEITHIINHHSGSKPLFDTANIEEEINTALSRRVNLSSGGYLVIDQTEALTSIDVNTGGFVGFRNFNDTIFRTNLEASVQIARQLRLRNLGGIIIIDFIDMENIEHQQAVLESLQKALTKDRTRTSINNFSPLGLVEMTRKRTRESLTTLLTEPCATCHSRGFMKTPKTIAYHIMREILREAKQFNPKEFRLILAPSVLDLFLDEESNYLAMLDDFIGKPISLEVNNAYHQEMYDIILL